jgi:hypothetical protein
MPLADKNGVPFKSGKYRSLLCIYLCEPLRSLRLCGDILTVTGSMRGEAPGMNFLGILGDFPVCAEILQSAIIIMEYYGISTDMVLHSTKNKFTIGQNKSFGKYF